MPRDGFKKRQGGTVMHQSRTQTNSPQRSGAYLVPAALKILFRQIAGHLLKDSLPVVLASGLQDSVAGTHVVHQEISIGVQREGSERGWNRKRSAVDFCSCRSGGQCLDMASRTSDLVEKTEALLCSRAIGELRITRGRFRRANEAREAIDIGKTVGPGLVIRLRTAVAHIGDLIGLQTIGDAHFVEVRVGGER